MTIYSPISLLMVFSGVLKKAMHSRLTRCLHANNILITEQYGFRNEITSADATFRTNSVFKSTNQKFHVGGFFFYLAKAFVCMDHEIY